MKRNMTVALCAAALAGAVVNPTVVRAADPWADTVVAYSQGTNPSGGFINPAAALGSPTRFTDPSGMFGGVVTPFNASFGAGETVSLGVGGSLTLQFAEPVTNDPLNPYGIDLIVFGNAFLSTNLAGLVDSAFVEGGLMAVSANGVDFFNVPGDADGLRYPTNAYADILEPYTATPGAVEANFTKPVNPAFDPLGKTFAQVVAGYEGSGGGLGVDIGPTGLSSISYVRITNPVGASASPEIDAVADVASIPEPTSAKLFCACALILLGKFARTSNVNAAT